MPRSCFAAVCHNIREEFIWLAGTHFRRVKGNVEYRSRVLTEVKYSHRSKWRPVRICRESPLTRLERHPYTPRVALFVPPLGYLRGKE